MAALTNTQRVHDRAHIVDPIVHRPDLDPIRHARAALVEEDEAREAREPVQYRSELEDGDWSTPVNLGCSINSAAGEASPFLAD